MTEKSLLGTLALVMVACSSSSEEEPVDETELGFEVGPEMLPGDNCLRCHSENSKYPTAPRWTAAGTVFAAHDSEEGVAGAEVTVTAADGKSITLTSNRVGNFYTAEPLTAPLRIKLTHESFEAEMPIEAPAGSCNACHSWPDATGDALGRIRVRDVP